MLCMLGFPCREKTVWLKIIIASCNCKPVNYYSYHFDEYLCGFSYTLVIKTLFFCRLLVDLKVSFCMVLGVITFSEIK